MAVKTGATKIIQRVVTTLASKLSMMDVISGNGASLLLNPAALIIPV